MSASGHSRASGFRLVVTAASLGGLPAYTEVLSRLPADFPVPIMLVQHGTGQTEPDRFLRLLARRTPLPVRAAEAGLPAAVPGIAVVPKGMAASIDADGRVELEPSRRFNGGDTLFASAATAFGAGVVGVVLTGMGGDGRDGVRAIKGHGGRVIVQEPESAAAPSMPSTAMATGCVDFVLPLDRIAAALIALTMAPGGAQLLTVPPPAWARLGSPPVQRPA
jgi:two-component system chemotaxis response regulator CheB